MKEHRAFVRRERPLLYLTVSRGKKLRHTSAAGQRIQMLPAVFFGSDDELIADGPIDYTTSSLLRHVWKRSLRRRAAVPYFFGRSGGGVRDPYGPRMRLIRGKEEALGRISRLPRSPHKGDAPSVQRPRRITIGIDRWAHEFHGLSRNVIDGDECVVRSNGDEG